VEPADLLRHVTGVCERLGLRYLVTGSMATIFFGEPRLTNDIDVVVDLPRERIGDFAAAFPAGEFYVSEEAIRRAVLRRSQFNVIHPASGYEATFASPEDVILKKLEYYREGGSEKHVRDIAGILKVSGSRIDRSYLEEWATRLELTDIWEQVRRLVEGREE
jgi:hypothetical protein